MANAFQPVKLFQIQKDRQNRFVDRVRAQCSNLDPKTFLQPNFSENFSPQLISPYSLEIASDLIQQARDIVRALYELKENKNYVDFLKPEGSPSDSACLCCDFHVDKDGFLKLIEVNTNASFLAASFFLYENGASAPKDLAVTKLSIQEMFQNAWQSNAPKSVAIVDEAPGLQNYYFEFEIYRSLFLEWGWPSKILDAKEDLTAFDCIYNRSTDFYLHQSPSLAFATKRAKVSPNPWDYQLLAHKENFVFWSDPEFLKKISLSESTQRILLTHTPKTRSLEDHNREELWQQRKKLFFKPKQSYGSKGAFRGSSITRNLFDSLPSKEFIAQEFLPAETLLLEGQSFKIDYRFFFFRDQILSAVARLYQGQVTNLKTPGGGWTPLHF